MMQRSLGLAFNSDLSYGRVFETLNAVGPWRWRDRDSAWYGNFASARIETPAGALKLALIESGANDIGGTVDAGAGRRYAISAAFRSDHPDGAVEWDRVRSTITDRILPALQARDLCDTDVIDD